jgi:3',5'-cyclic-AMP phosphodiesterase
MLRKKKDKLLIQKEHQSLLNTEAPHKKKVLRIAHLSDMHIYPKKSSFSGVDKLLNTIYSIKEKPDLIINTGDNIMDSLRNDKQNVSRQWRAWNDSFNENIDFDIINCIGNHDVWGWQRKKNTFSYDKNYGKQWAMNELGLNNRYFSFDLTGWHFIVLDSTHPHPKKQDFIAMLDDDQFEWLARDLKETPVDTPICIASHIPILNFSATFNEQVRPKAKVNINANFWMHRDAERIGRLFTMHKNIILCLSGHVHVHDRINANGIHYITGGAVCGGWWSGRYLFFPPAYAIVDLFDDGTYTYNYKIYDRK